MPCLLLSMADEPRYSYSMLCLERIPNQPVQLAFKALDPNDWYTMCNVVLVIKQIARLRIGKVDDRNIRNHRMVKVPCRLDSWI